MRKIRVNLRFYKACCLSLLVLVFAISIIQTTSFSGAWIAKEAETSSMELGGADIAIDMTKSSTSQSEKIFPGKSAMIGSIDLGINKGSAGFVYELTLSVKQDSDTQVESLYAKRDNGAELVSGEAGVFLVTDFEESTMGQDTYWTRSYYGYSGYNGASDRAFSFGDSLDVYVDIASAASLGTFDVTAEFRACQATRGAVQDFFGENVKNAATSATSVNVFLDAPLGTSYAWYTVKLPTVVFNCQISPAPRSALSVLNDLQEQLSTIGSMTADIANDSNEEIDNQSSSNESSDDIQTDAQADIHGDASADQTQDVQDVTGQANNNEAQDGSSSDSLSSDSMPNLEDEAE